MTNTININNTTPAAPANRLNIIWQNDEDTPENVSAYMPTATSTDAGAIVLTSDLGGSATAPNIVSTHLTDPLPIAQGGTGVSLSSTGGASNVLKQISTGANVTVSQLAFTDISGIVGVSAGGTGTASPGIVAGANIGVTGSWPNQAIAVNNVPTLVASINLTDVGSSITQTTWYNVPSNGAGIYRASVHITVTNTGGGSMNATIAWTNDNNGSAGTFINQASSVPFGGYEDSTTQLLNSCPITLYAAASTPISYATEFIDVSGSVAYNIHLRLEYLG